eukprot:TRINITY_DN21306_c0_g2_i1.p1 TRINITY_DN21306_c0_g2~~TRINITY_DN21306_c0_g2_i1.p1  ORF type:complete len:428 (-),score=102.90 TRINITY_DN21306_c0_g2_i1:37-1320(-)
MCIRDRAKASGPSFPVPPGFPEDTPAYPCALPPISGISKRIPPNETVKVWWARDAFTAGVFEDNTGCRKSCFNVRDKSQADFLVSTKRPSPKTKEAQWTVHFSRESLFDRAHGHKVAGFDLTMDMAPQSNVAVSSIPAVDFWQKMLKLPIPTIAELKKRKFAIFLSSHCGGLGWDRTGWVKELTKFMHIDLPGNCLRNMPFPTKRAGWGHNDDHYKEYLFVFGLTNNIDNRNFDEKVFQPFRANSVPVVKAHPMFSSMVIDQTSFIDSDRFMTPESLANYLTYLRDNLSEYQKLFNYRKRITEVPKQLQQIQQQTMYQKGTLCRLCACKFDAYCMQTRNVTQARGYLGGDCVRGPLYPAPKQTNTTRGKLIKDWGTWTEPADDTNRTESSQPKPKPKPKPKGRKKKKAEPKKEPKNEPMSNSSNRTK